MVHDMKDSGVTTEPMDMEEWFMQKVIFMKENGLMIKLMEKELIRRIKEVSIKELGQTTNKTDSEQKSGEMALDMKACMKTE